MAHRRAEPEAPVTPEPVAEPVPAPEEVPTEVAPEPEPVVEVADPLLSAAMAAVDTFNDANLTDIFGKEPEPVAPEVVPEPPARIVTAKWEGMTLVNIKSGTVLGRLSPLSVAFIGGPAVAPIWFAGQMEVMGPASGVGTGREWLTAKATRAGWVVA